MVDLGGEPRVDGIDDHIEVAVYCPGCSCGLDDRGLHRKATLTIMSCQQLRAKLTQYITTPAEVFEECWHHAACSSADLYGPFLFDHLGKVGDSAGLGHRDAEPGRVVDEREQTKPLMG